jgi:hypothetical protein
MSPGDNNSENDHKYQYQALIIGLFFKVPKGQKQCL